MRSHGSHYLATFTGDAAIVVARGFVPAHYTQLILVQVTRYVPYTEKNG